jgi:hypothetical protein
MGDKNQWRVSLTSTGNICRTLASIVTGSEVARAGASLEDRASITWLI